MWANDSRTARDGRFARLRSFGTSEADVRRTNPHFTWVTAVGSSPALLSLRSEFLARGEIRAFMAQLEIMIDR